ncbi:nidogen-like [Uranotaenia lowii]|uniref:nidogen-like n=1 Tax=Uranotaenia lowii TaxID=190385 RepID=UPI00247A3E6B|nr:nidogen-like [Uranotaenia lowii]
MKLMAFFPFAIFVALNLGLANGISTDEWYNFSDHLSDILPWGDEQYAYQKLKNPVHFYSEKYDHVYINTNGILTFASEFQNYLNLPFPIEYPSIAPFYANVDTTSQNQTAAIAFFTSRDADLLKQVEELVRSNFRKARNFEADEVFVATWANVGHFNMKADVTNSFQVALILGEEETYVQFLYPENGINWIQGDSESGLPDVRAQAGFISEDGRYFPLQGSGTDNIKHLTVSSNAGVAGTWLFRVGPLDQEGNVEEPDLLNNGSPREPRTCAEGGHFKCHSAAVCKDSRNGYCCTCKAGYYGNGFSCVKNDVPLRVVGAVKGTLNQWTIDTQMQSYVVMADGRTYTALSPLEEDIGTTLQIAHIIGSSIGWLFAKPIGNVLNGYQLTGGKFNQTSTIDFEGSRDRLRVELHFNGLNMWDQLSVDINIEGSVAQIPLRDKLQVEDYSEIFQKAGKDRLEAYIKHRAHIPSQNRDLVYSIRHLINYETCKFVDYDNYRVATLKNSKINLGYEPREKAIRMGMLNKISSGEKMNPCDDANCGDNTVCVPNSDDSYDCNCKNGFTYVPYSSNDVVNCVDIDECSGVNICDENARCINEPGGYKCYCNSGFEGNGFQCEHIGSRSTSSMIVPTPANTYYEVENHTPSVEEEMCEHCSEFADCIRGRCECKMGYAGDGFICENPCDADHLWNGETCVRQGSTEEYEIAPFCTVQGCTCPTGYTLIEYAFDQICRLIEAQPDDPNMPSCDVENNCSPLANCEWNDHQYKYECVCNPGYDGNGYTCVEKEVSCLDEEDICDQHASCNYIVALKKSICVCNTGYEGDGRSCQLAPECTIDDDCGMHSVCNESLCVCQEGFERDFSDFCVRAGSCGGVYCAENAICKFDRHQGVPYCYCPEGYVGNGVQQCKSIPPPCNVRNNCGLHATCGPKFREPSQYECTCNPGFFGDGFVCTPERNCANIPSLCDRNAKCVSTTSGYQCICNQGFIGNGSICSTAPRLDSGFLLISQGVANVRVPFNGARGVPVTMAQMSIGVDKDCATGRIYWSDISAKQIASSKYDGTDRKPFITKDIVSPEGVAVDWISRRLYWTDSAKDTIEVASLDNPDLRTVVVSKYLVNPRGIAVDPHQSKLYWSDWNREAPKIEWSNLDGTEREVLVSGPNVQLPNSIQVAPASGELCFADAGTKKIECIDTYSKHTRTIASNLTYPFGLAVTDDHFYWTDWTTKKVESINVYGERQKGIPSPVFGTHIMYGMTAVTDKCPLFHSPCVINNGDCPEKRICLTNPRAPSGRGCKCADAENNCNDMIMDY